MSKALLFWLCMLLWLVFGTDWSAARSHWRPVAGSVLLFILLLALGWAVFGSPVQ